MLRLLAKLISVVIECFGARQKYTNYYKEVVIFWRVPKIAISLNNPIKRVRLVVKTN
jgi:hypothetical protein